MGVWVSEIWRKRAKSRAEKDHPKRQKTKYKCPPPSLFKEQTTNSSDEHCDEDDEEVDDDDDDDDSYYDEDGQLPAAMVTSTEKTSTTQSTITNNGSGATLSIRNAKSVSKKSKPVINVRPVIKFSSLLLF